jgi:hypothetical protein
VLTLVEPRTRCKLTKHGRRLLSLLTQFFGERPYYRLRWWHRGAVPFVSFRWRSDTGGLRELRPKLFVAMDLCQENGFEVHGWDISPLKGGGVFFQLHFLA